MSVEAENRQTELLTWLMMREYSESQTSPGQETTEDRARFFRNRETEDSSIRSAVFSELLR